MDTQCSLSWGSNEALSNDETCTTYLVGRSLNEAAVRTDKEERFVLDTRTTEA